jgi:AAA+ superfamily predicted ATPase
MSSALPNDLLESAAPALVVRVRLRARRNALWMRHLWKQGLASADQGLAITHGEVDRLLAEPAELAAEEARFYATDAEARALREPIAKADLMARRDHDWTNLCDCFEVSGPDSDLLALALAVELDPGLARVYGYLHDEVQASHATPWLAARLFQWPADAVCGPASNLVAWRLAEPAEAARNPWSTRTPWIADPALALSLQERRWHDPALGEAASLMAGASAAAMRCLYPDVLARMRSFVESVRGGAAAPMEIELIGPAGAGKRTLASQLAATLERDLLVGDAAILLIDKPAEIAAANAVRLARMARATRAVVYWRNADGVAPAVLKGARGMADIAVFDRDAPGAFAPDGAMRQSIRLPTLSSAGRLALWRRLTAEPAPAQVRDRLLGPAEIAAVARAAPLGEEAVQQACRRALQPPSEVLQPLPCPYTRADLVLAPDTQRQLDEFEQQARLRWPVYEDWGFERLVPLGKGITALFAGASGVGKTMAAQVLAQSLDLDLYRVDLAGVVNKYIGETEKRLKQVFDFCERANVMVLFDEADALFGQRTQVKDAHDRFANIEIDYLLQRMEQFSGIAVLATNRKNDLDKAFLRRLRFLVDFLPPGPQERMGLWRRALLPQSPSGEALLDDIDWNYLAEQLALTGADIKQAALGAAFLARGEGTRIGMRHIFAGARREMTKHGVVLRAKER